MSLNPPLNPQTGLPVLKDDQEKFIFRTDNVKFTVTPAPDATLSGFKSYSGFGRAYVSQKRLVLVWDPVLPGGDCEDPYQALEVSLHWIGRDGLELKRSLFGLGSRYLRAQFSRPYYPSDNSMSRSDDGGGGGGDVRDYEKVDMELRLDIFEQNGRDEEMLAVLNAMIDDVQAVSQRRKLDRLAFDAQLVPTNVKIAFVDPSDGCRMLYLCTQMTTPQSLE